MNTAFLLMAQYHGQAVIPLDVVARDYFPHLSVDQLNRKVLAGDLPLPVIRIEGSQKATKGIHLQDLADYIDRQRSAAVKEFRQINGLR